MNGRIYHPLVDASLPLPLLTTLRALWSPSCTFSTCPLVLVSLSLALIAESPSLLPPPLSLSL